MRSAEFDKEHVLRQAMAAFIAKGYAKTSMSDLTKATGLHPGSIYCAFGNKQGLLLAALDQYHNDINARFSQFFSPQQPVLASFRDYLAMVLEQCCQCGENACLLMRSLNELSRQDAEIDVLIAKRINQFQDLLAAQFQRAMDNGELGDTLSAPQRAEYLQMGIFGLRTLALTKSDPPGFARLLDKLFADCCQ